MKKFGLIFLSLVLACLSFALAYFSYTYALGVFEICLLLAAGFAFGIASLFFLGYTIGKTYLEHPQNTQDFSHEVLRRKRAAIACILIGTICFIIAFCSQTQAIVSLIGFVITQ